MKLDTTPLSRPLARGELAAYARKPEVKTRKVNRYSNLYTLFVLAGALVGIITILVSADRSRLGQNLLPMAIAVGALVLVTVALVLYRLTAKRAYLARCLRLEEFCAANNMIVTFNEVLTPQYAGIIFNQGLKRTIIEKIVARDGSFEVGSYKYTISSGRSSEDIWWGYVKLRLKRRVPQMVLDAVANNTKAFGHSFSDLPDTFSRGQKLELEGDFNNYFTLYAPVEYEQDALRIFTPDLMQTLIDDAANYDLETVDDQLYIYNKYKFDLLKPETWAALIKMIRALDDKFMKQTEYYADERMASRAVNEVAEPGKRLKTTISVVTILAVILYLIYAVLKVTSVIIK